MVIVILNDTPHWHLALRWTLIGSALLEWGASVYIQRLLTKRVARPPLLDLPERADAVILVEDAADPKEVFSDWRGRARLLIYDCYNKVIDEPFDLFFTQTREKASMLKGRTIVIPNCGFSFDSAGGKGSPQPAPVTTAAILTLNYDCGLDKFDVLEAADDINIKLIDFNDLDTLIYELAGVSVSLFLPQRIPVGYDPLEILIPLSLSIPVVSNTALPFTFYSSDLATAVRVASHRRAVLPFDRTGAAIAKALLSHLSVSPKPVIRRARLKPDGLRGVYLEPVPFKPSCAFIIPTKLVDGLLLRLAMPDWLSSDGATHYIAVEYELPEAFEGEIEFDVVALP